MNIEVAEANYGQIIVTFTLPDGQSMSNIFAATFREAFETLANNTLAK